MHQQAVYNLKDHPLLSGAAKALSGDEAVLDAWTRVAEAVVGLGAPALDGTNATLAKDALALQVSFMYERGIEAAVATAVSRGARSITYRETDIHPTAARILAALGAMTGREFGALRSDQFPSLTTLRPSVGSSYDGIGVELPLLPLDIQP